MRKLIAVALAALVLPLVFAAGAASAQEKLRLPFAYIFSGPFIEFGERVWNEGLVPGVAEVNKRGGIKGKQVEFYKVDVRFPETAGWIAEFRRLCKDEDVPVVFGVGATKSTIAIFEDSRTCGVPVLSPSSGGAWPYRTDDGMKDFGCCMFRYQPVPDEVMPVLIKTAKERLNISRAALSHSIDDDFAANNIKVSRKALQDNGVEIVDDVGFKDAETNFASQVASFRRNRPDVIVMHHQPGPAGTFLLQLRDRGVDAQVVTDIIVGGIDFWKQSNGKAIGSIGYSLYSADDPSPAVQEWVAKWRAITGKSGAPDAFVTTYYDAVQVLAHVMNQAESLKREDILKSFLSVKDHQTISGTITWNNVGDIFRPAPILVRLGEEGVIQLWN